jgi:hypothetical protein
MYLESYIFIILVIGYECRPSRFFAFNTMTQDSPERLVRELIQNSLAEA